MAELEQLAKEGQGPSFDVLDAHLGQPTPVSLGPVVVNDTIRSDMGPFKSLPEYRVVYPGTVVQALAVLVAEYNTAFAPLVAANQETDADYRHCFVNGSPVNFGVQIDMPALPEAFLALAASMSMEQVVEILRRRIFEIENSLAMYQLLRRQFARGGISFFESRFADFMDTLRRHTGKPVALLAVTDQKYESMRSSEFGKSLHDKLPKEELLDMSGFDAMFSPDGFSRHLRQNGGESAYALYARTSDPVAVLRDPTVRVGHELLGNNEVRHKVRQDALTFNVDTPTAEPRHRLNDTKMYMPAMGMGVLLPGHVDLVTFLKRSATKEYFEACGVDPEAVIGGQAALRAKPALGTYGCYGHIHGRIGVNKFEGNLNRERQRRGSYILQPELPLLKLVNELDEEDSYIAIDRNFLGWNGEGYIFLGGFRSLMPDKTMEARKGRNHGSKETLWAEVVT
ncbi:MAG: hypothetical protein WCK46_01170 [Candidatus Adlerbacteria bacterium]